MRGGRAGSQGGRQRGGRERERARVETGVFSEKKSIRDDVVHAYFFYFFFSCTKRHVCIVLCSEYAEIQKFIQLGELSLTQIFI